MANSQQLDFKKWNTQGAVYGFGDHLKLFWGDAATALEPTNFPAIYSNDFFLENPRPWTFYRHTEERLAVPLEKETPPPLEWIEPDFAKFQRHFESAQERLQSGKWSKVVLATETLAEKKIAPDIFLRNVLGPAPSNTHLYGQWNEERGFLGFTPETLFVLENATALKTMALAGTSAIENADSALATEKNLEEHEWVVRDIATALSKWGKVSTGRIQTLPLQTLAHLYTPIAVALESAPVIERLIETLHPTPALGTSPRDDWRSLQEWREGYGSFGAPFVVAGSPDRATAVVGIRQLAWDADSYYIRCGCGVVKGSRLEDEWQELLLKIQSVKRLFGWNEP